MLLCAVYRPRLLPTAGEFFGRLSSHLPRHDKVVITGDCNSNMADPTSSNAKYLYDALKYHSFHLLPSNATNYSSNKYRIQSYTWLDLFIVHSSSADIKYVKPGALFEYCHDRIDLSFEFGHPKSNPRTLISRDLCRFDRARYICDSLNSLIDFASINSMRCYIFLPRLSRALSSNLYLFVWLQSLYAVSRGSHKRLGPL